MAFIFIEDPAAPQSGIYASLQQALRGIRSLNRFNIQIIGYAIFIPPIDTFANRLYQTGGQNQEPDGWEEAYAKTGCTGNACGASTCNSGWAKLHIFMGILWGGIFIARAGTSHGYGY